MSKRSPKSVEEKLEIVQWLLNHEKFASQLSEQYGVSESAIHSWVGKYKKNGVDGLQKSRTWKPYSTVAKEQAVQDYLDEKGSFKYICQEYDSSSHSVLQKWIKRYTSFVDWWEYLELAQLFVVSDIFVQKLVTDSTKKIFSIAILQLQHLIKNSVQMSLIFHTG